jgi:hypothetical protein
MTFGQVLASLLVVLIFVRLAWLLVDSGRPTQRVPSGN